MMETKGRILLAEDDDHLRELVKDALEDEDYQVTGCSNGQKQLIHLIKINLTSACWIS
jgi:DNA-binding response OmpR family regulator